MVTIKFYGLIRSNHRIETMQVKPGTLREVINQIQVEHPQISDHEFLTAVVFINQTKVMHMNRLAVKVNENDEIVFTNFVGGG